MQVALDLPPPPLRRPIPRLTQQLWTVRCAALPSQHEPIVFLASKVHPGSGKCIVGLGGELLPKSNLVDQALLHFDLQWLIPFLCLLCPPLKQSHCEQQHTNQIDQFFCNPCCIT